MRRILLLFVGLLMVGGGLFAGGQAEPAEKESVEITWVTHPVIFGVTGDGELLEQFTAETGIKVNVVTFPTDGLRERIPAEFIAGSDSFDVLHIAESFWTEDLAQYVEDLGPYVNSSPLPDGGLEDFSGGQVRQFRVPQTDEGAIYGIPQRMGVDIMFYRKDLFEEHGIAVPTSLDEYYEAAAKLTLDTDGDGDIDIYGATYQGIQGNHGVLDWYDMAAPLGAKILTPDGTDTGFNNEAGRKALQVRRDLYQNGYVSPGVLAYSFDDAINLMAQGQAAMTIMYGPYWATLENPETSQVAGRIGYARPPKAPDVDDAFFVRGWGMFINGESRYKDEAWEFIKFLTSKESQLYTAINHGNPPSRFSVLNDPEYRSRVPAAQAQAETLEYATIQPNVRVYPQVQDILGRYLHAGIGGEMEVSEALNRADREIRAILQD